MNRTPLERPTTPGRLYLKLVFGRRFLRKLLQPTPADVAGAAGPQPATGPVADDLETVPPESPYYALLAEVRHIPLPLLGAKLVVA